MKSEDKELLLRDLCSRLPCGVKVSKVIEDRTSDPRPIRSINLNNIIIEDGEFEDGTPDIDVWDYEDIKPYLFPLSSMTDEDHAIYLKIWEDAGKMAYLEGCHHFIINIKAYKAANDYLLSKHYDINGLIPKGLAINATNLNIY